MAKSNHSALIFTLSAAAVGVLAWAYLSKETTTMPSNEAILGLTINDELTLTDMHNIRRIGTLNNFDPILMAKAAAQQVYGYCMQQAGDAVTLEQLQNNENDLSAIAFPSHSINTVSGANMTWTVDPEVYRSNSYVAWYNQLDHGMNEIMCSSMLYVELKRLFTRFVELAGKYMSDYAILTKMQPERTAYMTDIADRSATGFAGTILANVMQEFDNFLKSMVKFAPTGVNVDLNTHNHTTALKF